MSSVELASLQQDARSGKHRRRTSRPVRRHVLTTLVLLLLCYVYWHLMLRWFFLQRDDFWLVSITDDPLGRFDAKEFLWRWAHDWAVRNGRSSDALVRALLRPGVATFGWLAPAVLTACFAAAWRWLPRSGGRTWTNPAASVLLLCVVPVALLTAPSVSGNTVFWAAGIGNYVVPTGLALFATSWWVQSPESRAATAMAVGSILAASALHELAAFTQFVVAQAWWLLNRGRVSRLAGYVVAASWVGLLIGFVGPGRWRRLEALAGDSTGASAWVTSAARFTSELLLQTAPVWAALFLGLGLAVVATWRSCSVVGRRRRTASLLVAGASGGAAWALARTWRMPDVRCSQSAPLADNHAGASVGMLVVAAVTVLATGIVLNELRTSLGDSPLLLGSGALATLPLPMITGQCAPRVWYPVLVWVLVLLAIVLITLAARRYLSLKVLGLLTAVALLLGVRFLTLAEPALRANHSSFMGILEQVSATQQEGHGTIRFPAEVPFPHYAKEPVYRLPSIACGFRTYYAVPDDVLLDDGTSPDAGHPDYCPRPDDPRAGR